MWNIYYARITIDRRDIWRSLKTSHLLTARRKIGPVLEHIRAAAGRLRAGNLTLAECAAVYLDRRHTRKGKVLKPRSLDYRAETVAAVRGTWPGFDGTMAALVTPARCAEWARKARPRYSATRFNGMVESLRGIFKVAIGTGAIDKNPMLDPVIDIPRASVRLKQRMPVDRDLFGRILMRLDGHTKRRHAALAIRALAFTGLRPNEARNLAPADYDAQRHTLRARVTKNGLEREIELIPQAVELFESDLAGVLAALKKSPRRALATVCRELKIARLTPYDMRVMFSSRMDEAGVTLAVGAETLGHQDRGQTRLKHYIRHDRGFVRGQMSKVVV